MLRFTQTGSDTSRPYILYLHGLGIAGWCWQPVVDQMHGHDALIPDLPGHGGSAAIAWHSLKDSAEQVARVVDTVPRERAIYVTGHSLGAYVGSILLTLRPDRFAGAMLSGFHVGRLRAPMLWNAAYAINGALMRLPFVARRMAGMFGSPEMAEQYVAGMRLISARTIRRGGQDVVAFRPPALDDIACRVLAVAADGEPDAIRRMPEALAGRYGAVTARMLDGRDHLWPLREPELYAEILQDWFAVTDLAVARTCRAS